MAFKCLRQNEKCPRKSALKCHGKAELSENRFKGEILSHTLPEHSAGSGRDLQGGHKEPARGGLSWAPSQKVWN